MSKDKNSGDLGSEDVQKVSLVSEVTLVYEEEGTEKPRN
jgi:hypothetical protein